MDDGIIGFICILIAAILCLFGINLREEEKHKHEQTMKKLEYEENDKKRVADAVANSEKFEHEKIIAYQNNATKIYHSAVCKAKPMDSEEIIGVVAMIPGVINGKVDNDIFQSALNPPEKKCVSIKSPNNVEAYIQEQAREIEYYDNNLMKSKYA